MSVLTTTTFFSPRVLIVGTRVCMMLCATASALFVEASVPIVPASVASRSRPISSSRWGIMGGGGGSRSRRSDSSDIIPMIPTSMEEGRPSVQFAARRGKRTKQAVVEEQKSADELQKYAGEDGEELTLEEMRAALGPVGKTVAGAVEVGVITAGSYLSGGILGYIGGGLFGLGSMFRPSDTAPPPPPSRLGAPPVEPPPTPKSPPRGFGGEFRGRLGNVNSRAISSAKSWAQLSAAFSGFHALTRVVRGGKEDRWNGIVGSAMTGAYLNRQGGPQAMVQGATTYASFTYLLDVFFSTRGSKVGPDGQPLDDQFQYQELELN